MDLLMPVERWVCVSARLLMRKWCSRVAECFVVGRCGRKETDDESRSVEDTSLACQSSSCEPATRQNAKIENVRECFMLVLFLSNFGCHGIFRINRMFASNFGRMLCPASTNDAAWGTRSQASGLDRGFIQFSRHFILNFYAKHKLFMLASSVHLPESYLISGQDPE